MEKTLPDKKTTIRDTVLLTLYMSTILNRQKATKIN